MHFRRPGKRRVVFLRAKPDRGRMFVFIEGNVSRVTWVSLEVFDGAGSNAKTKNWNFLFQDKIIVISPSCQNQF